MKTQYEFRRDGHTFLTITDTGIEIQHKGFINAWNKGGIKGTKSLPFASISAVQLKKPGLNPGYIQFTILGGNESRGGLIAAEKDENTIMFGKKDFEDMAELKTFIEQKIAAAHTPIQQAAPESDLDQLKKLKDLLDTGVLTQDEFDAKKAQILNL